MQFWVTLDLNKAAMHETRGQPISRPPISPGKQPYQCKRDIAFASRKKGKQSPIIVLSILQLRCRASNDRGDYAPNDFWRFE
jgi:hypothetical protein